MSYISAHTMIKPITKAPKRREVGPLLSEHAVRRFFGLVFGFAAIGLWLLPSANVHTTLAVDILARREGRWRNFRRTIVTCKRLRVQAIKAKTHVAANTDTETNLLTFIFCPHR